MSDNLSMQALQTEIKALQAENVALRTENKALQTKYQIIHSIPSTFSIDAVLAYMKNLGFSLSDIVTNAIYSAVFSLPARTALASMIRAGSDFRGMRMYPFKHKKPNPFTTYMISPAENDIIRNAFTQCICPLLIPFKPCDCLPDTRVIIIHDLSEYKPGTEVDHVKAVGAWIMLCLLYEDQGGLGRFKHLVMEALFKKLSPDSGFSLATHEQ